MLYILEKLFILIENLFLFSSILIMISKNIWEILVKKLEWIH